MYYVHFFTYDSYVCMYIAYPTYSWRAGNINGLMEIRLAIFLERFECLIEVTSDIIARFFLSLFLCIELAGFLIIVYSREL